MKAKHKNHFPLPHIARCKQLLVTDKQTSARSPRYELTQHLICSTFSNHLKPKAEMEIKNQGGWGEIVILTKNQDT